LLQIDTMYINQLSSYVRNFKQKDSYLWNFSCPFCGDSTKDKKKARGYVYRKKNDLYYRCHNCSKSTNFGNLLKCVSEIIYNDWVFTRYKEGISKYSSHKELDNFSGFKENNMQNLHMKESEYLLPIDNSNILDYCLARKIPQDKIKLLRYTNAWYALCNDLNPEKYNLDGIIDHDRLVIPYYNESGEVFYFQGRALETYYTRYLSLTLNDTEGYDKIYGLERVNKNKTIYVVEGPLDSLFLDNCIALGGAHTKFKFTSDNRENIILVFDREPRNKEIIKTMQNAIKEGFTVSILPETLPGKDINDCILEGYKSTEIQELINTHAVSGIEAELKLASWRKV
jgi:transcription elongation factor Elf1